MIADPGLRAVKVFADGADLEAMIELADSPLIAGFTTNPTLMRKSGVTDYEGFAHKLLDHVGDRPVSFEVFADGHVKIPVTDTDGATTAAVVRDLAGSGIHLNVTALMTVGQVEVVAAALADGPAAIISVFAGRIADTGRDPVPLMSAALTAMAPYHQLELLWASPREILNVRQADDIGVHIITMTPDLLRKLALFGRDLEDFSLETVRMFYNDAARAGYLL
jgi:transaldolase